jgi:hypothetical protein
MEKIRKSLNYKVVYADIGIKGNSVLTGGGVSCGEQKELFRERCMDGRQMGDCFSFFCVLRRGLRAAAFDRG